jgi:hypothetical protein
LYRIKYADGDLQHMTEQQVKEMQIHEKMLPFGDTCTLMGFFEGADAQGRHTCGKEEGGERIQRPNP